MECMISRSVFCMRCAIHTIQERGEVAALILEGSSTIDAAAAAVSHRARGVMRTGTALNALHLVFPHLAPQYDSQVSSLRSRILGAQPNPE